MKVKAIPLLSGSNNGKYVVQYVEVPNEQAFSGYVGRYYHLNEPVKNEYHATPLTEEGVKRIFQSFDIEWVRL